jgi:hypothetical protein
MNMKKIESNILSLISSAKNDDLLNDEVLI